MSAEKDEVEQKARHQLQRIEKQRAAWLEERAALVGGSSGGPAAADKIVQLSRKTRDLNAELAAERGQVVRLTKELNDLKVRVPDTKKPCANKSYRKSLFSAVLNLAQSSFCRRSSKRG